MTNDNEIVKQVKQLKVEVMALKIAIDLWENDVEFLGNQCASTDRKLEGVIDIGVNKVGKLVKKISRLHDGNK